MSPTVQKYYKIITSKSKRVPEYTDISVSTHRTVGVQIPAGTYIFVCSKKSGPAVSPTLTTSQGISWASFPGVSGWEVNLTCDVLLIAKFGKHGAAPPRHHTFL